MAAESEVQSEIEVLQSIYLEELQVDRREDGGWAVSLVLYPSTAEDSVSQFVRLTLTLTLDRQYPSTSPVISIHHPRGLSDDKLSSVQKCLQAEAQSSLGSPVLYQLIEKAKEILTDSNIPHGNCVICLYGFKEGETFTKTGCYHYFHSHCLGRYVSHSERELRQREKELQEDKTRDGSSLQELTVVCPVCREPLTYDVHQLLSSPAPELPELDQAAIGSDFQRRWGQLQQLLEKQRCNGGIINPEEESNRFLIHIQESPPVAENGDRRSMPLQAPMSPPSNESSVRAERLVPGLSQFRGFPVQRRQNQARWPRRGGRPKPHPGQGPPSHRTWSSSPCPRTPRIRQRRSEFRETGADRPRGTRSPVRTEPVRNQRSRFLQIICQLQKLKAQKMGPTLLAAGVTEGEEGAPTGLPSTLGPLASTAALGQPAQKSRRPKQPLQQRRRIPAGHYGRGLQQKVVDRGREEVV